jgi:cytochrome c-type biogenesis protein CcmH/NrfG
MTSRVERQPRRSRRFVHLGDRLLAIGRKRDALTAIKRILRFDPDHVGALYYAGILHTEHKRFREAIDRWRRVNELAPSGDFARRARREARTAMDLDTIFSATAAAGV